MENRKTVRFLKYSVTNGTTTARVRYSVDNHVSGRKRVHIWARDYTDALYSVFEGVAEYHNATDIQTDYFEKGDVSLFEDHPLYAAARARAEANKADDKARWAKTLARRDAKRAVRFFIPGPPADLQALRAAFDARPDSELSLPVRAERDRNCLECLSQRRCHTHAPAAQVACADGCETYCRNPHRHAPLGPVEDHAPSNDYEALVASLEGSCRANDIH